MGQSLRKSYKMLGLLSRCFSKFYTPTVKKHYIYQGRSKQSSLSGHGQTAFSQGKNKIPLYKKQVINKGARVIFGLASLSCYSIVNRKAVFRVRKLLATHACDLFKCSKVTVLWKI